MQPREKKLLMIVGGLLAVGLLIVGIRQISSAYKQRATKQTELKDSLFAQEVQIRGGIEAKKKLAELESLALSGEDDRSKAGRRLESSTKQTAGHKKVGCRRADRRTV